MKKIEELFAFVVETPDGEGVPAVMGFNNMMLPMMGADIGRMQSIWPRVKDVLKEKNVKLYRFTNKIEIDLAEWE